MEPQDTELLIDRKFTADSEGKARPTNGPATRMNKQSLQLVTVRLMMIKFIFSTTIFRLVLPNLVAIIYNHNAFFHFVLFWNLIVNQSKNDMPSTNAYIPLPVVK